MPVLSDANLGLMLQELTNRPTIASVNGSSNAPVLKALWTSLTFYQWTPAVQPSIDGAIRAAMLQPGLTSHVSAVALTRDAMMREPDFFPFCLSPRYWPSAQAAYFRGPVDATTYQPPSYWHAVASEAAKMLFPVVAGAAVAWFLPEEMVGGAVALAAARLGGKTVTEAAGKMVGKLATGIGLSGGGMALGNSLGGTMPGDAAHESERWRRYKLEVKRRAMAA